MEVADDVGRIQESFQWLNSTFVDLVKQEAYKKVKDITVEFWYLDSGEVQEFTYRRDQLRTLKARWRKAIKPILEARRFPAQPDEDACRWCSFRSDKKLASGEAGPCGGWREV